MSVHALGEVMGHKCATKPSLVSFKFHEYYRFGRSVRILVSVTVSMSIALAMTVSVCVSMGVVAGSTVNVGTETMVVSNVGHVSPATIGFTEGVLSLDIFTITVLRSLFHISGVVVIDSVRILVFGVGL